MNAPMLKEDLPARNRGRLWVTNYVQHYAGDYDPESPWARLEAARDLISDALHYVDALALEHHLPIDGSADILADIVREFSRHGGIEASS